MSKPTIIFDEAVEQAALRFFSNADADAISRCRGVTYDEAVHQLRIAKEKTRQEVERGGPITVDGKAGVLMWFIASAEKGTLPRESVSRPSTRTSWWHRHLGNRFLFKLRRSGPVRT